MYKKQVQTQNELLEDQMAQIRLMQAEHATFMAKI